VKADKELLAKLEKLSHLYIAEEKKDEVISQLSDILAYVDNLCELDTSSLDSYFSTIEGGTPIREDIPQKNEEIPKSILEHAPEVEDDFFIVPAIIE
jgi:aspartyl-tRNA(Asn)/glutamyl-tRNA(Gln) amidotransferase subunit C